VGVSIAQHAQELALRWGLDVRVDVRDHVDVLPEKQQEVLRIVGEALSNAARHADATTISVHIGGRGGRLLVAISDDGRGFDADEERVAARGFGLRSMRERAQLLGGDVRLASEPGSGTRVEIAIP
jgi:signal transduction histidine kinase